MADVVSFPGKNGAAPKPGAPPVRADDPVGDLVRNLKKAAGDIVDVAVVARGRDGEMRIFSTMTNTDIVIGLFARGQSMLASAIQVDE
jgi:hypothetical protein